MHLRKKLSHHASATKQAGPKNWGLPPSVSRTTSKVTAALALLGMIGLAIAPASSAAETDGLFAGYALNETAGTSVAQSVPGGPANGTLIGNGSWGKGVDGGNAVSLKGSDNDYVGLPSNLMSNLTDFSVSMWVKPDRLLRWQTLFTSAVKPASGSPTTYFIMHSSADQPVGSGVGVVLKTATGSEQRVSAAHADDLKVGVWSNVSFTLSGTKAALYLDGRLVGTNENFSATPKDMGLTDANYLGKAVWPDPSLQGGIDDFRIYNRSLSATEVTNLMSNHGSENVEADLKVLKDTYGSSVVRTTSMNLPSTTERGSDISWVSSDPAVVEPSGFIHRPAVGQADAKATLTATLKLGLETRVFSFQVTVKALTGNETSQSPGLLISTGSKGLADSANLNYPTNSGVFAALGNNLGSISASGLLTPKYSEDYTFELLANNAQSGSVTINGVTIVPGNPVKISGLIAHRPVAVQATFGASVTESGGNDRFVLNWSSPSQQHSSVPNSAFSYPISNDDRLRILDQGKAIQVRLDGAVPGSLTKDNVKVLVGNDTANPLAVTAISTDPKDSTLLRVTTAAAVNPRIALTVILSGPVSTTVNRIGDFSAPLYSTWGEEVSKLSETQLNGSHKPYKDAYPRPQLQRQQWANFNGIWEFQATSKDAVVPSAQKLNDTIVVPYPMESALSRIADHHDYSLYRKNFSVDSSWCIGKGNRYFINFGAVDFATWIYVNGQRVKLSDTYTKNGTPMPDTTPLHSGTPNNVGGYAGFSVDVTDYLKGRGPQELVLKVEDTTDLEDQQVGKQNTIANGIDYTTVSGIWQTVWAEPRPEKAVNYLAVTPELSFEQTSGALSKAAVQLTVAASGTATNASVEVLDSAGKLIAKAQGKTGQQLTIPVPNALLWSPSNPYLYQLKVSTRNDSVHSYFALRKIEVGQDPSGTTRVKLNGKPTFMVGTLDQGWWPDGLYTAPSPEALKFDLSQQKDMGYNMIRKHIKTEPDLWYADADALGLLVLQDMPTSRTGNSLTPLAKIRYLAEAERVVKDLSFFPSIVTWVPFNEGWGTPPNAEAADMVRIIASWDPSRLILPHTGQNVAGRTDIGFIGDGKGNPINAGELVDRHEYSGPALGRPDDRRAFMDGEHGGYSYYVPGHSWENLRVIYSLATDITASIEANNKSLLDYNSPKCYMSGSVYTQTTDVEREINGLMTYDRRVTKIDIARLKASNTAILKQCDATFVVNSASVSLQPDKVKAGSSTRVTLKGFPPGEKVTLSLSGPAGLTPLKTVSFTPQSQYGWPLSITIPFRTAPGEYQVRAIGQQSQAVANTVLTVLRR
ncbi:LamG-like jellyroll fold domain-containing protein [Psychromicrobium sp. YIM B11713]|uniref:LamG-like jellyroll fold domain-containing protein n=1 Tax=Psychromicrobium sp. YIM B11713 TaxID=3145233 RepID=UPI00374F1B85